MLNCRCRSHRPSCFLAVLVLVAASYAQPGSAAGDAIEIGDRELSRPARCWEFLDAVGKHSSLLGNESGRFEAWVYPVKIFRDFDITFVTGNQRIPAASLVRRLTMRPEGPTLTFASDSFTVNESWLAPPEENGAIVRFEINTWEPLEIEASFTRDFQLMWPAGLGGTYMSWDAEFRAFALGEESRKFAAMVGSPSAVSAEPEFFSNSYTSARSKFRLSTVNRGTAVQYIFVAGASNGSHEARTTYQQLADHLAQERVLRPELPGSCHPLSRPEVGALNRRNLRFLALLGRVMGRHFLL